MVAITPDAAIHAINLRHAATQPIAKYANVFRSQPTEWLVMLIVMVVVAPSAYPVRLINEYANVFLRLAATHRIAQSLTTAAIQVVMTSVELARVLADDCLLETVNTTRHFWLVTG